MMNSTTSFVYTGTTLFIGENTISDYTPTARLHYIAVPVGLLQFNPGSAFTLRAL